MNHFDLVEIEWRDACTHSKWYDTREAAAAIEDLRMHTVGYLLHKDKECIKLVQSYVPAWDEVSKIYEIPMGMVKKIKVVRKGIKGGK